MTQVNKIQPAHLQRQAFVYVRQSSLAQVERNRESTQRQYGLVARAQDLGWTKNQIVVVDDLGISGAGIAARPGFTRMTSEVALGQVGIILALEVSRLARNSVEWYRLLDLCAIRDTLIADADGLYDSGAFNDRLLLGLKGTMSEAELHWIRARLEGGIRNKAERGELRRGLPVGFVWGDGDGDVLLHPDEAVQKAIQTVFERFPVLGSARQVWLWFRSQGLPFPSQATNGGEIRWGAPTYMKIHQVLTNPVYAGAYVYGKSKTEKVVDEQGRIKKRVRRLPPSEWAVLIPDHHEGYIDWDTYEAIQERLANNIRPQRHEPGPGAVREGCALLQGLAVCGHCGRRLNVYYSGRNSTPGYYCPGKNIANGRGEYCLRIGGVQLEKAVVASFLATIEPAGIEAALLAAETVDSEQDAALAQWRLEVERARYEAQRAERRYRSVDPLNRLVARGLESEWEQRLRELSAAETELIRRESQCRQPLSAKERKAIIALGNDLPAVWDACTTTDRDRKELLRTLLEEVLVTLQRADGRVQVAIRWKGGVITDIGFTRKRPQAPVRTDEETVDLIRRLAKYYPDAMIAGILNRQGRRTVRGLRFSANRVAGLRKSWKIPRYEPPSIPPTGELLNVKEVANALGLAPSTVHRWLAEGLIGGEQLTPGAPWQIRMTDELRARFVEQTPPGYVAMIEATKILGVSRQTVMSRIRRSELEAVHVCRGRRKGLRIKVSRPEPQLSLFKPSRPSTTTSHDQN